MNEEYKTMECPRCGKMTTGSTVEIEDTLKRGKYVSCMHCGCKDLKKAKKYSGLNECMSARTYKRNGHGAMEEIK